MALKRGGLGRGLDSLIPDKKKEQTAKQSASSKDEVKAAKKTSGKKAGLMKVLTSQFFRRMRHGKQTRSILKQVMRPGLLI